MTAQEFRTLDVKDLRAKIQELKEDRFWLEFKLKSGQLDNPTNLKDARKDLARATTVLNEKLNAATSSAAGEANNE